ncbi:hypothetical protein BJS_04502 [Bradyrhizobium japonicum SEMIA 5079]|nr:hypothetical protein BJS_04502 [Bradyrhizobium japonicum SEMIA 5079]
MVPCLPTLQPLVADLRTDPKTPTQLPPVRSFLQSKPHKLASLIHYRHLVPGHGRPPKSTNPAQFDVSAMSPNTCQ